MDNQKDPLFHQKDDLLAENNLLKLKLGLEHGMKMEALSEVDPAVENQWLKSVYAFEQQFKEAKIIKVYDRIGRPAFSKCDQLTPVQITVELNRLRVLMENHGVELDCIWEYDDAIIYRFLTEELFDKEMDDMHAPGMTMHFIYEEFYPNHEHDLRRYARDLISAIYARTWNDEFDSTALAQEVTLSGRRCDGHGISSIIATFQEAHAGLVLDKFDIDELVIDAKLTEADVTASLSVSGRMKGGDAIRYAGTCSLHFIRESGYWYISEFAVPGIAG